MDGFEAVVRAAGQLDAAIGQLQDDKEQAEAAARAFDKTANHPASAALVQALKGRIEHLEAEIARREAAPQQCSEPREMSRVLKVPLGPAEPRKAPVEARPSHTWDSGPSKAEERMRMAAQRGEPRATFQGCIEKARREDAEPSAQCLPHDPNPFVQPAPKVERQDGPAGECDPWLEIERLKANLEVWRREVEGLNNTNRELVAKLQLKREENIHLGQRAAKHKKDADAGFQATQRVKELEERLTEAANRIRERDSTISRLEHLQGEAELLVATYRNRMEHLEAQDAEWRETTAEPQYAQCRQDLYRVRQRFENACRDAGKKKAEIARLKGIIDSLSARIAKQSDQLSRLAEKKQPITVEIPDEQIKRCVRAFLDEPIVSHK
jgi:chromosome segregation ATPase